MATHTSVLTWRIPWTEEPGGLQSMALQSRTQPSTHTANCICQIYRQNKYNINKIILSIFDRNVIFLCLVLMWGVRRDPALFSCNEYQFPKALGNSRTTYVAETRVLLPSACSWSCSFSLLPSGLIQRALVVHLTLLESHLNLCAQRLVFIY